MTTTTPLPTPERAGLRGFTLVEVMIGATISSFILLAVMTTFLFLGRSGANVQNYNDMESQARTALELFAEDTRQASAITWITKDELYLTVNAVQIYYYYVAADATFYRKVTTGGDPRALVTGVTNFDFSAYSITGALLALDTTAALATAGRSTKQLQISLEAARSNQTVVDATNTVLSARFILRNKRVTA
jgi:prepilin-type N-terminal cleavage/methylation domain-containing protein